MNKVQIHEKYEASGLKPSSSKIYTSAIITIVKKIHGNDLNVLNEATDKWFSIEKFKEVYSHIKQTTKRNYISAIVGWMKIRKEEKSKLYATLSNNRDEYNHYYERIISTGEKTDYEKAMWVEPEVLRECFQDKILPFLERMNFTNSRKVLPIYENYDNGELKKIRDYVIMSIYLYPFYDKESNFGVIRNDVATLHLTDGFNLVYENNYFIVGKKGMYTLRMVDYKTQTSHGVLNIPLPLLLGIILKRWCIFSQKKNNDKVFANIDKHHVTEILQRGLKTLIDKPVGVQMLRKIYVSWRFGKKIEDEKEVADSMMHTISTQQNVYAKK